MSIEIIDNLTITLPRILGGTKMVFEPNSLNFSENNNMIIVTVEIVIITTI